MNSNKTSGRLAGLLYFMAALTGGFSLFYIRSKVIVPGDAAATVANIMASQFLYRAAIVSNLAAQVFTFFVGLILFHLFKEANKFWATVFLASVMMTVGLAVGNTLNHFQVLLLLGQAEYLKVFSPEQLNALAMTSIRLANGSGQGVLEIFWTPYYFSFGLLVFKYRFMPRIVGVLLMIMGIGYTINILDKFLVPQFHPLAFTRLAMTLGVLGGIPTLFWLLIKGANEPQPAASGS